MSDSLLTRFRQISGDAALNLSSRGGRRCQGGHGIPATGKSCQRLNWRSGDIELLVLRVLLFAFRTRSFRSFRHHPLSLPCHYSWILSSAPTDVSLVDIPFTDSPVSAQTICVSFQTALSLIRRRFLRSLYSPHTLTHLSFPPTTFPALSLPRLAALLLLSFVFFCSPQSFYHISHLLYSPPHRPRFSTPIVTSHFLFPRLSAFHFLTPVAFSVPVCRPAFRLSGLVCTFALGQSSGVFAHILWRERQSAVSGAMVTNAPRRPIIAERTTNIVGECHHG